MATVAQAKGSKGEGGHKTSLDSWVRVPSCSALEATVRKDVNFKLFYHQHLKQSF